MNDQPDQQAEPRPLIFDPANYPEDREQAETHDDHICAFNRDIMGKCFVCGSVNEAIRAAQEAANERHKAEELSMTAAAPPTLAAPATSEVGEGAGGGDNTQAKRYLCERCDAKDAYLSLIGATKSGGGDQQTARACPECSDAKGWTVGPDKDGFPEQQQCRTCFERQQTPQQTAREWLKSHEGNNWSHPDHCEQIKFEGRDCYAVAPEDYQNLLDDAYTLADRADRAEAEALDKPCEWSDAGAGQYTSDCDRLFTPTNNLKGTLINFPFCPGCGRKVKIQPQTNEEQ